MTNNNTVPAALANTAEADREAFAHIMASDEGRELMSALENDIQILPCIEDFGDYPEQHHADAAYILGRIDDTMEAARGILYCLTGLREAYVNKLGIPAAIEAVVDDLQVDRSIMRALALTYGLDLMGNSDRRLPQRLHEGLIALGMPKTIDGRAANTFRLASRAGWARRLLEDISGVREANKQVRAMQGTAAG